MALKGKLNGRFSFDSKELIEEIKNDIAEFGREEIYAVWLRKYPQYNVEFIVNYDFIIDEDDDPFKDFEVNDDYLYGKFEKERTKGSFSCQLTKYFTTCKNRMTRLKFTK